MEENFLKKFCHLFPCTLLLTFFLFTLFVNMNKVNADTINITLTDDMFSKLDHLSDMQSAVSSVCSPSGPLRCEYFIRYQNDFSYQNLYFAINRINPTPPCGYIDSGTVRATNDTTIYSFSSDFSSVSTSGSYYNSPDWQTYQSGSYSRYLLYANFDIPWCSSNGLGHTLNFTYNGNTYTLVTSSDNHLPTIYDLDLIFNPPTPTDDFPLLTSFVSISLDKLSLICDFITSNYVFLFMFVIFVFYFIILLFRRLK